MMEQAIVKAKQANWPLLREEINHHVDDFLAVQDVKENSKGTYRRALKPFVEWITMEGITGPSRKDIIAYKRYLEETGISPLTITSYMTACRKFFEWAEGEKLYPNIAKGVKGAKREKGFRKDALTVPQVKRLLDTIDRSTIQGKRDFALLNLLVRTGLRTVEVIRADYSDIRQEGGEAVLQIQGKGRDAKDDFVLLTEETLLPLRAYLSDRGAVKDDDPLFISLSNKNQGERLTTRSVSRIVKENLKRIGLNDRRLTAHSLRHTALTFSLLGGATIQQAKILGRHSSVDTTLVYSHNIDRIAHAPERNIDALLNREPEETASECP